MHLVPRQRMPGRLAAGAVISIAVVLTACSAEPASRSPASTAPAVAASPAPTDDATTSPAPTSPAPTGPAPTSPAPTSPTTASPVPLVAPPPPSGVGLAVERGVAGEDDVLATRYTVSWTGPLDAGTTIRVIGVTSCPVPPPATGERTCVTEDTILPAKIRTLIAKGPASAGSLSWLWPYQDVDGPVLAYVDGVSYVAYVVRAVNDAGASRFVVVQSTVTCPDACMD